MCINIHGAPSRKYKQSATAAAATRRGNYTKSGRGGEGHKLELSAPLETSAFVTHKRRRLEYGNAADGDCVGQGKFQVLIF